MREPKIRKEMLVVEDTFREAGVEVRPSLRKVAAIAVIDNPMSGKYIEDLSPLVEVGEYLGGALAKRAVEALGIPSDQVKGFGKAVIVGSGGELEHGAAIIHPKMGKPFREAVSGGKSIIPSTKKRGTLGTRIDVPIFHKDDQWAMPYLDSIEVGLNDAPAPDEIVVIVALTNAGRPLSRVGGGESSAERSKRTGSVGQESK